MENDAYTSKELAEMIYELKIELGKTQTLIRGYNGLRETQDDYGIRLKAVEDCIKTQKENKKEHKDFWYWIIPLVIGIFMGLISKFF